VTRFIVASGRLNGSGRIELRIAVMTKKPTPVPRYRGPRLLGVIDVAGQTGVSSKTVHRWIEHGGLRVHRLGRLVRVAEDDLVAFLNSRRS
jgi:excisionase family DNA binding protein